MEADSTDIWADEHLFQHPDYPRMLNESYEAYHDRIQLMEQRLNDVTYAVVNELAKSALRKHYRKQIEEGTCTNAFLNRVVSITGKDAFKVESRGRKKQTLRKMVTISAQDGIDPSKFFAQMKRCVKKSMLQHKEGYYVIEQRSEGEQEPYGWHIHWLVEFDCTSSPKVISQQVYQCFKRFLAAENYVDVKDVHTDEHWNRVKDKYLHGDKRQEKLVKSARDKVLRAELGLPSIILSHAIVSTDGPQDSSPSPQTD